MKAVLGYVRQNAIALVALMVALSGTAYAANKIGAQDIARDAIRSPHIKSGQVKGSDLARGLRQRIGSSGAGAAEQLQVKKVDGPPLVLAPGGFDGAPVAQCPSGYVVVGTGFNASIGEAGFVLAYGTFVGGFFSNSSSLTIEAQVQALCARSSGGGAVTSRAVGLRRFQQDVAKARAEQG